MKQKILIVEFDMFLAGIYAQQLEQEGFDVSFATNGNDGLKLAEKDRPDLVLLGLRLQPHGMDGFELLTKLKADATLAHIPVLVLTNLAQKEDVERCQKLGCAGYLIKAHTMPSEAVRKIKELLHGGYDNFTDEVQL